MEINLFSDRDLMNMASKSLEKAKGRDCVVVHSVDDILALDANGDPEKDLVLSNIREAVDAPRQYSFILGSYSDSHNDLEKLGVCRSQQEYTVVLSLEDSLCYLLHRLSGTPMESVRKLPNYQLLSRAILKLNSTVLDTENFYSLFQIDERMQKFMDELYDSVESEDEFVEKFFRSIFIEVQKLLDYICAYIYLGPYKKSVVIRSKGLCSYVLTASIPINEEIILKNIGFDDHTLKLKSFKRKEYISAMHEPFAV